MYLRFAGELRFGCEEVEETDRRGELRDGGAAHGDQGTARRTRNAGTVKFTLLGAAGLVTFFHLIKILRA